MRRRRRGPFSSFMKAANEELGRPSLNQRQEARITAIDRRYRRRLDLSVVLVIGVPLIALTLFFVALVQIF